MWYPLAAALHAKNVDHIYVSTDSEEIEVISKKASDEVRMISRPPHLATDESFLADVIQHGYGSIKKDLNKDPELLVIILCNAATVSSKNIDKGIEMVRSDGDLDSAATVTFLNQYAPMRAKKIVKGRLVPAIDIEKLGVEITCDRNCMGDIYFCDASLWVIKPLCMDYRRGQEPFRWMGRNIAPIVQRGGLDVDDKEGMYLTEQWLKKEGFTETKTPYDHEKRESYTNTAL